MSAFLDIKAALETVLAGLSPALPTQWEGTPITPPTPASGWLRTHLLPAVSKPAGLGSAAQTIHTGIFQVSVFWPAGVGTGAAVAVADAVAALFHRGSSASSGSTRVEFLTPSIAPLIHATDDPWLHIPVSVPYRAFAPAQ